MPETFKLYGNHKVHCPSCDEILEVIEIEGSSRYTCRHCKAFDRAEAKVIFDARLAQLKALS